MEDTCSAHNLRVCSQMSVRSSAAAMTFRVNQGGTVDLTLMAFKCPSAAVSHA